MWMALTFSSTLEDDRLSTRIHRVNAPYMSIEHPSGITVFGYLVTQFLEAVRGLMAQAITTLTSRRELVHHHVTKYRQLSPIYLMNSAIA
jgi:hypothetical protein